MFKKPYKYLVVCANGSVEIYRTRKEMWDNLVSQLILEATKLGVKDPEYQAPEKLWYIVLGARGINKVPRIYNRRLEEITDRLL